MNFTKLLLKTLHQTASSSSYYTNRVNKATLYSRISPLGSPNASVVVELDDWLKNGGNVNVSELKRIIKDLRKRRRYTHALQVSEWMNETGICAFSHSEHAIQLDLIGKVRGFVSAESYFRDLKDQDKTEKTYGALLNCYVRQRQTEKCLSHLQKMKELGFTSSTLPYNNLMCLYTSLSQHEKVIDVMTEMKENGVAPDIFSYKIILNSYGARFDVDGFERILREMENHPHIIVDWNTYSVSANFYIKAGIREKAVDALRKLEERLDEKDGMGFNHLISLHATLGDKAEVLRLWVAEKNACKRYLNVDFINMLESLARLNELEEAEKVLKEWESSGNSYDFRVPKVVVIGYTRRGLHERAEALLDDLMEKGKVTDPGTWVLVAAGFLARGHMKKSLRCMNIAISVRVENKVWEPNPRVVTNLLNRLGDEGSAEEVEAFVGALRTVVPVNRDMYRTLMKAYKRDGKEVDKLLERMKADNIDGYEETEI